MRWPYSGYLYLSLKSLVTNNCGWSRWQHFGTEALERRFQFGCSKIWDLRQNSHSKNYSKPYEDFQYQAWCSEEEYCTCEDSRLSLYHLYHCFEFAGYFIGYYSTEGLHLVYYLHVDSQEDETQFLSFSRISRKPQEIHLPPQLLSMEQIYLPRWD